ncbi:MAG: flagellar basal body-associated protein FliL [Burkholderiaceae bacterium]
MATTSAALPLPTEEAPPKSGKRKLLVILIAVFAVLALAGGGAAWRFHQKAADVEAKGEEGTKSAKKPEGTKPPVFNTLEAFTVNLAGGDHFLQLGIVLQLKDEETGEKVKTWMPQIRSRLLLLLSSKTAEDLETSKGKRALVEAILAETRAPLGADGEKVQAVLLGSMLVQ